MQDSPSLRSPSPPTIEPDHPAPSRDEDARPRRGLLAGLASWVEVDARALGAFRIGLGVLYIASMLRRFADRAAFYAADGVFPSDFPSLEWNQRVLPSPFWGLSTPGAVDVGFALCALVFLCFLLGLGTRVMAIASWLALIALHNRMEFVETGGDIVLLVVALYATMMPLGDRYSVDSVVRGRLARRRGRGAVAPVRARVAPTFGLILAQWSLIYGMNGVAKNGEPWREGYAVLNALRVDRLNTWLGQVVADGPRFFITAMTYGTLVIEIALPFLLLAPPRFSLRTRAIAAASILGLHLGIAATMNVGVFSFAMISIVPLLLPSRAYDVAEGALRRLSIRVASPDASAARGLPSRGLLPLQLLVIAALATAMVYQACYERLPIPGFQYPRPEWFTRISDAVRWRQGWTMFAPNPPGETDLVMVDAVTRSGEHVDPFQGHFTGRFEPMRALPGTQGLSHFWVAYQDRIHRGNQPGRHLALARFIEDHPRRTGRADEKIDSFVVWRLFTSTFDRWRLDPREEARARGQRLFASDGALPLSIVREDGVPDAARMTDSALAPAGFVHSTPLAAVFASRCAYVDFDLGASASPSHAFVEAFDSSRYYLMGSVDGTTFTTVALVAFGRGAEARFAARTVAVRPGSFRYLRVAAPASDGRAAIAELRLYGASPELSMDQIDQELAREVTPGAPPDAPYRESVLHSPGSDNPCVRADGRKPLLRPNMTVGIRR